MSVTVTAQRRKRWGKPRRTLVWFSDGSHATYIGDERAVETRIQAKMLRDGVGVVATKPR
jgi:hypothetical protein